MPLYSAIVRQLARQCHDRRVWVGEQCHLPGRHRVMDRMLSLSGFGLALAWQNHRDTHEILRRFPEVAPDACLEPGGSIIAQTLRSEWTAEFIDYVTRVQRKPPGAVPMPPAFSVVIPFYAHLKYLPSCFAAVLRAWRRAPDAPLEVVIVNDDPSIPRGALEKVVPDGLLRITRIVQNPANLGICATLNRAVNEARHAWILHLDCDDCLSEDCLAVLQQRIRRYPRVRYISSRMIDVDAEERLLRVRLRGTGERPSQLLLRGMVAGHLKAIRRDLFESIGAYEDRYAGCQDYEFALRASLFEPLMFIPEYLYQYRWHGRTQSVARANQQAVTTNRIVDAYLLAGRMLKTGSPPCPIEFRGPSADQWCERFPAARSGQPGVAVEVRRPFNPLNHRLFAIHMARHWVEHHSGAGSPPPMTF